MSYLRWQSLIGMKPKEQKDTAIDNAVLNTKGGFSIAKPFLGDEDKLEGTQSLFFRLWGSKCCSGCPLRFLGTARIILAKLVTKSIGY